MCPWYTVGGKMSDKNLEQWIDIVFCVQISKSPSETLALLAVAYGEYAIKKLSVFEWHRQLKEGQDDLGCGQPKTHKTDANVDKVQTVNQQCYLEVLTRLWKSVCRKRSKLWPDKLLTYEETAQFVTDNHLKGMAIRKMIMDLNKSQLENYKLLKLSSS
jgi:hypothetical protein